MATAHHVLHFTMERGRHQVTVPGKKTGKGAIDAWIEETIALCRERFALLFDLMTAEQEFLDSVLDRGEANADLLDVSPEIRTRIAAMPMLAWKCQNVCAHKLLIAPTLPSGTAVPVLGELPRQALPVASAVQ